MVINIKREKGSIFPKAIMIEPWAIDIILKEGDAIKLTIKGLAEEIYFDYTKDNRMVIFSPEIYRVDIIINGVDVSDQYRFR